MELLNVLTTGAVMGTVNPSQAATSVEGTTFQNQLVQIVNGQAANAGVTEGAMTTGLLTQLVSSVPVLEEETLTTQELDQLVENLLDQLETLKDSELTGDQLNMLDGLMQQLAALLQVITLQNEQPAISFDANVNSTLVGITQSSMQYDAITKLQDQLLLLQQALQEGSTKMLQGKQPEVIITNQLQQLKTSLDDLVKQLNAKQIEASQAVTSPFVVAAKEDSALSHLQRLSQEVGYTNTT
ncbi:MAG TPA: hypothetical protein IAA29_02190, partial [Candidatus Paenibacillus intestinavium]|nr:hypothetical protein [Candidatus Paenibacillus intestinavium]